MNGSGEIETEFAEQTLTLSAANARSEPNHVIQAMSQFGQTNLITTAKIDPKRTRRNLSRDVRSPESEISR
jgi:hypothetical protein